MATPGTKPVTLSDGSVGEIPDNLDPASETAFITRLDASNKAAADAKNQQNSNLIAQPGPELFPAAGAYADTIKAAVGSGLSKAGNAITSTPGLGWTGPTANMAANVGANVVSLPWDAPAAITNAITQTAKNYGYAKDEPDFPLLAPKLKSDLGITPTSGTWAPRIENAATIASTLGESLLPSAIKGAVMEGVGEGGSYLGQKIAENTDPRLSPLLQVLGATSANAIPWEHIGSVLFSPQRPTDAGKTLAAAMQTQADFNAANPDDPMTRPPITAGQVGGNFVKGAERIFEAVPIMGMGVANARANAKEGMVQGRDTAATAVGATPTNTTPNASGDALYWGVRRNLTDTAQQMDNVENTIANYQRPGGGDALIDVHPLLDALQAMQTRTDPAGNVYPNVAPAIGTMIDNEIANINSARVPEDQNLHVQLQSQIQGLHTQINDPNTPPQNIPALQAQLDQAASQMDANLKIPFTVLRQMKTLQSYDVNPQTGMPTLNGHMGGQVLDAYRNTIQGHVNNLDPQLAAQYQAANDQYKTAADATRAIGNSNEGTLSSMMRTGMGSPSEVAEVAQTPVWGQAAGNQIRQTGQNTKGEFVPRQFAAQWDAMTPAAKQLYTQTFPAAADTLDNVSQLARKYDIPPEAGGLTKSLAWLEVFNRFLEGVGMKGALAAAPAGYLGESMPLIRSLAGRPQPYFQTLSQNLPALAAVAAQQQRQKQPGSTP
jgi:hypothetical protein